MTDAPLLRVSTSVERKAGSLPRFVVVPAEVVAPWDLEGTTVVEASLDGVPIGRRTLKHWGRERDVWFVDLTGAQCERAGVDTGDAVVLELRRADEGPPPEIARRIEADPSARRRWESLTPSRRRILAEHVRSAKKAETRERRARKALEGDGSR